MKSMGHAGINDDTVSFRAPILIGTIAIIAMVLGAGAWISIAPLASAAIAPGVVVVDSNRKVVQHLDGGIIKQIYVRDGDHVEAGQILIALDPTRIEFALSTLRMMLAVNIAQQARLEAEQNDTEQIIFPSESYYGINLNDFPSIVVKQQRLFETRRSLQKSRLENLKINIEHSKTSLVYYKQQLDAYREKLRLTEQDLRVAKELARTEAGTLKRVFDTAKSIAELQVEIARSSAQIAEVEGKISSNSLEMRRTTSAYQQDIEAEWQQSDRERIELVEKVQSFSEQIRRLEIRSPSTGIIVNSIVHTIGGVLAAGAQILEIVPDNDRLLIEAQVHPSDIEDVRAGQPVEIRLSGLDGRNLPRLIGEVETVSADRMTDKQRGFAYFAVRIGVTETSLKDLGKHDLRTGMTVDVMILRGERTPFQYLAASFLDFFSSGLRE